MEDVKLTTEIMDFLRLSVLNNIQLELIDFGPDHYENVINFKDQIETIKELLSHNVVLQENIDYLDGNDL